MKEKEVEKNSYLKYLPHKLITTWNTLPIPGAAVITGKTGFTQAYIDTSVFFRWLMKIKTL